MSTRAPKSIPTNHLPDQLEAFKKTDFETLANGARKAAVGIDAAVAKNALEAMRTDPATAALDLTGKGPLVLSEDPKVFVAGLMANGVVLRAGLSNKDHAMVDLLDGRKDSHSIVMVHSKGAPKEKTAEARQRLIDGGKMLVDKDAVDPADATKFLTPLQRAEAAAEKFKTDIEKKEEVSFVACDILDDHLMVEKAGSECVVWVVNTDGTIAGTTKKRAFEKEPPINKKSSKLDQNTFDLKANQIVVVVDGALSKEQISAAVKEAGGNLAIVMAKLLAGRKNLSDTGVAVTPDKPLNVSLYIHKPSEPNEALNTKPSIEEKEQKQRLNTRASLRQALNLARTNVENLDPFQRPAAADVRSAETRQDRERYVAENPAMFDTPEKERAYIDGPKKGFFESLKDRWNNSVGFISKVDTSIDFAVGAADAVSFGLLSKIGKGLTELGEKTREALWSFANSRESTAGKVFGNIAAYTVGEGAHILLGVPGTILRAGGIVGSYAMRLGINSIKDLALKGTIGGFFGKAAKKEQLQKVFNIEAFFAKPENAQLKAVYDKLGEIDPQAQMNVLRQLREKSNEILSTQVQHEFNEEFSEEARFTTIDTFDQLQQKARANRSQSPRGRIAEFLTNGNEGVMVGPFCLRFPGFAHLPLTRELLYRRAPKYTADQKFLRDGSGHVVQDFFFDPSLGRAVKGLIVQTDAFAGKWKKAIDVYMKGDINSFQEDDMRREMGRILTQFTDEALTSSRNKKVEEARAARKLLDNDNGLLDRIKPALATAITKVARSNADCQKVTNDILPKITPALAVLFEAGLNTRTKDEYSSTFATGTTIPQTPYEQAVADVEKLVAELRAVKGSTDVHNGKPAIEAQFDELIQYLLDELNAVEQTTKTRVFLDGNPVLAPVLTTIADPAKISQLKTDLEGHVFIGLERNIAAYKTDVIADPSTKAVKQKAVTDWIDNAETLIVRELENPDKYGIAHAEAQAFAAGIKQLLLDRWHNESNDDRVSREAKASDVQTAISDHVTETKDNVAAVTTAAEACVNASVAAYELFLKEITTEKTDKKRVEAVEKLVQALKDEIAKLDTLADFPASALNDIETLQVKLVREAEHITALRDRTFDTYNRSEWLGNFMTNLDRSGWSTVGEVMRDRAAIITARAASKKLAATLAAPSATMALIALGSTAAGSVANARVHEGVRDVIFSRREKDKKDTVVVRPLYAAIAAKKTFLGMPVPEGIQKMFEAATVDPKAESQMENWVSRMLSNVIDGQSLTKLGDEIASLVPAQPDSVDAAGTPIDITTSPEWQDYLKKAQSAAFILSRLIASLNTNEIGAKEDLFGSITSRGAGKAVIDKLFHHFQSLELHLGAALEAKLRQERLLAKAGLGKAFVYGLNAIYGGVKDMALNPTETAVKVGAQKAYIDEFMRVDTAIAHSVASGVTHGLTSDALPHIAQLPRVAGIFQAAEHLALAPAQVLGSVGFDTLASGLNRVTGHANLAVDATPLQVLGQIRDQLRADMARVRTGRVAAVAGHAPNATTAPHAPLQPAAPGATAPHSSNQPGAPTTPGGEPFYNPNNHPGITRDPGNEPFYTPGHPGVDAPRAQTTTGNTGTDTPGAEQPANPSANPAERPAVVADTEGYVEAGTVTAGNIDRGREGRMMAVLDARYPELTDHQRNYIANSLQNSDLVRAARDSAHQGHSRVGDQIDVQINGDMVDVRFHRPAGRGHEASTAVAHVPLAGLLGNARLAPTDRTQMQAVLGHGPAAAAPAAPAANPAPATGTDRQHGSGRHGRHGGGHSGSGTGGSHHREGGHGSADHRQDRQAPTAEVRTASPDTLTPEATSSLVSYLRNAVTASGVTMQPVANQPGRIEVTYGSPARTFNINVQYHPSTGQAETLVQNPGFPTNDSAGLEAYNRVNSSITRIYAIRHRALEHLRASHHTGVSFGATERPNEIQMMYREGTVSRTVVYTLVSRDNGQSMASIIPNGASDTEIVRKIGEEINGTLDSNSPGSTATNAPVNNNELPKNITNEVRTNLIEHLRDELEGASQSDHDREVAEASRELREEENQDNIPELTQTVAELNRRMVIEPGRTPGTIVARYLDGRNQLHMLNYRLETRGNRVAIASPVSTNADEQAMIQRVNEQIQSYYSDNDTETDIMPVATNTPSVQANTATQPSTVAPATPATPAAPSPTPAPTANAAQPVTPAAPAAPTAAPAPSAVVDTARQAATNSVTASAPGAPQSPEAAVRNVLGSLIDRATNTPPTAANAPTPAAPAAGATPTADNPVPDFDPDNNDSLPGDDDGTPPAPTGGSSGSGPRPAGSNGGTDRQGERTTGQVSRVAGARTEGSSAPAATAQADRAPEAQVTRSPVDAAEIGHPSSLSIRRAVVEAYNQEAAVNQHLRLEARSGRAGLIDIQGTGPNTTDRITVMSHPEADGSLRVIRVIAVNGADFVDNAEHRNAALANKPLREVLAVLSARIAPQSGTAIRAINEGHVTMNIVHARTEAYNSEREAAARVARFRGQVTIGELEHEFHNADSVAVGQWLDRVNTETRIATVRSDLQGSGYLMDAIREFVSTAHNNRRVSFDQYPWARNITEERVLRAVVSAINEDGTLTAKELASSLGIPYNDGTTTPEMQTFLVPLREIAEYAGTHLRLTPQLAANTDSADQVEDEREARSERDIDDPEDTYARGGHNRVVAVIHSIADVSGDETITAPNVAEADGDELVMTNMTTTITESGIRGRLDDLLRSHRTANGFDDAAFVRDLEELRRSGERYMASGRARSLNIEIPDGRNSPVALAASFEDALDDRQRMAIRFGIALAVERHQDIVTAVAGLREVAAREAAPRNSSNQLVTTLSEADRTVLNAVRGDLPAHADLSAYSPEQLHQLATNLRDRINDASRTRRPVSVSELTMLGRVAAVEAERQLLTANIDAIAQDVAARINQHANGNADMAVSAGRIREQLLHFAAGGLFNFHNGSPSFQGAGVGLSREFPFTSDNGRHNFTLGLDLGVGGSVDGVGVGAGVHGTYSYRITHGLDFVSGIVAGAGTANLNPGVAAGIFAGVRANISGGLDALALVNGSVGLGGVGYGALLGIQYNPAHAFENMMENLQRDVGATVRPENGPPEAFLRSVVSRYGIAPEENSAAILANHDELVRRYALIFQGLENRSLEGSVHNGISGGGITVGMFNGIPYILPYLRITFGAGVSYEIQQAPNGELQHTFHDAFQEAVRAASRNPNQNGTTTIVTRMSREVTAPQVGMDQQGQAHVINGTGRIRETVLGGVTDAASRERAINAAMSGSHLRLEGNRVTINDPDEQTEYRIVNAGVAGINLAAAQDGRSATLALPSNTEFNIVRIRARGLTPNAVNQDAREIIMFCPATMSTAEMEAAAQEATLRTREFVAIRYLNGQAQFASGQYDTRNQPQATVASAAPNAATTLPVNAPTANRDGELTAAEMGDVIALDARVAPADRSLELAVYQYMITNQNAISAFRNRADERAGDDSHLAEAMARRIVAIQNALRQPSFRYQGTRAFSAGYNMERLIDALTDAANISDISNKSLPEQRLALHRRLRVAEENFAAIHPRGDTAARAGLHESNVRMRAAANRLQVHIGESAVAGLTEYTAENLRARHLEMPADGSNGYIVVGREQGGFTVRRVPGGRAVITMAEHYNLHTGQRDGAAMSDNEKAMVRMFLRETYPESDAFRQGNALYLQMLTATERGVLDNVRTAETRIRTDIIGRMPAGSTDAQKEAAVAGALAHDASYQALIHAPEYVRLTGNRDQFIAYIRDRLEHGVDQFPVTMPGNRTFTIHLEADVLRGIYVTDNDPNSHAHIGHCGNEFVSSNVRIRMTQEGAAIQARTPINMAVEFGNTAQGNLDNGTSITVGVGATVSNSAPGRSHPNGGGDQPRRSHNTGGGNGSDAPRPGDANPGSRIDGMQPTATTPGATGNPNAGGTSNPQGSRF
jgi:hypothetical protein